MISNGDGGPRDLVPETWQDVHSAVWYSPNAARQVLAAERLFAAKNRADYVGAHLWAAGFQVDERYWLSGLQKADAVWRSAVPLIQWITSKAEERFPNLTAGEAYIQVQGANPPLTGPLAKLARRLDNDEMPAAINLAADVAAGEFEGYSPIASERDQVRHFNLLAKAFDFDKGSTDSVLGASLNLESSLEDALRLISRAQSLEFSGDFSSTEIEQARDNVRNGFKTAVCLHEALNWIYGDTALGLRFAAYLGRTMPSSLIMAMTMGMARLRRLQTDFYSSAQIAEMAAQAERNWLMSDYLQNVPNIAPNLAHLVSKDSMKLAFSSSYEQQKMLKKLQTYSFPEPQFRPWETWQKLASKTTPSGLLVMSIGAPHSLDLGDIVPVASAVEIPLVLCGHGVVLRIEAGTLLIRNGFTHHPQQREEFRFFKGDLDLPPKIIMLDGSGSLSFDVIAWLATQCVPLFCINYMGEVVSVVGGAGIAFDVEQVRWQIETRADPIRRLEFCCDLITEKITGTINTMQTALPDTPARAKALDRAARSIDRLQRRAVRSVNDVMMIEAGAAAAYFAAWRGLPLRWSGRARSPIPPAWRFAEGRGSMREGLVRTNRNATHPVNAMLNYAYALLHSQVQLEAVSEGYDPRHGLMHESRPDAQALVLDLMEVHRPTADAAILKFVGTEKLSAGDFVVRDDGVCRLTPQLARRVTMQISELLSISELTLFAR